MLGFLYKCYIVVFSSCREVFRSISSNERNSTNILNILDYIVIRAQEYIGNKTNHDGLNSMGYKRATKTYTKLREINKLSK